MNSVYSKPQVYFDSLITSIKQGIHQAKELTEMSKGSEFLLKVILSSIPPLSYIPALKSPLVPLHDFAKEIEIYTNLLKGLSSIDGLVNPTKRSLRAVALNVSGLALFLFNCISIAEKFEWANFDRMHALFAQVPVLGRLSLAGLPNFAVISLLSLVFLNSQDKKGKLLTDKQNIQSDKLLFWSAPLNQEKIQQRLEKYEIKMANLALSLENSPDLPDENLSKSIREKRNCLIDLKHKKTQWQFLSDHFDQVDQGELARFSSAKENKWVNKIHKIDLKIQSKKWSMAQNVIKISLLLVTMGATLSGLGVACVPFLKAGAGLIDLSLSINHLRMEKTIDTIETSPVNMEWFFDLQQP